MTECPSPEELLYPEDFVKAAKQIDGALLLHRQFERLDEQFPWFRSLFDDFVKRLK